MPVIHACRIKPECGHRFPRAGLLGIYEFSRNLDNLARRLELY